MATGTVAPPPGFVLDTAPPPPPPGFQLDETPASSSRSDVPSVPGTSDEGTIFAPNAAAPKKSTGMLDKVLGVGDAALTAGTGMIAQPVGNLVGVAEQIAKGKLGDRAGGEEAQRRAAEVAQQHTWQPRTETGMGILGGVGRAVDASGIAGLGPMGAEFAAIPRPPVAGIARQAGRAIGNSVEGQMIGAPVRAAGEAVSGALKNTARGVMQSALKPGIKALQTGKAGRAVDTMLEEGVNVSPGGVDKLKTKIGEINDAIAAKIADSPAIVKKERVASRLQEKLSQFEKQVNPTSDLKAIQKAWDEFLEHPLLKTDDIPVSTAQEMKQGTYRALGDKSYGELKGAEVEAQKTLARGLKEEIAKAVPEVQQLNAQESGLLNALSLAERRVLVEANKNPVGLGFMALDPKRLAAWMADRSGLFKSIVARMLNTASKKVPFSGQPSTGGIPRPPMLRPPLNGPSVGRTAAMAAPASISQQGQIQSPPEQ